MIKKFLKILSFFLLIGFLVSKLTKSNYNFWTDEEIDILKKNYGRKQNGSVKKCEKLLPRHPKDSIVKKAKELGLDNQAKWTKKEENIIKKNYGKMSNKELLEQLPNRTMESLKTKAQNLEVSKDYKRWAKQEDEILLDCFTKNGRNYVDACQKKLPHRTKNAIKHRIKVLKEKQ